MTEESKRFWVAELALQVGEQIRLSNALTHRLLHVLRLQVGDQLRLFNGSGVEYLAELRAPAAVVHLTQTALPQSQYKTDAHRYHRPAAKSASQLYAYLCASYPALPPSPLRLQLAQGIAKGDKMDWIIQKISEIGAVSLIPLITERTQVGHRYSQTALAAKQQQRWETIAIGAAEQSGRDRPLVLQPPTRFADWCAALAAQRLTSNCLMLQPDVPLSLTQWLARHNHHNNQGQTRLRQDLIILVGPEGGWSPAEIALAQHYGIPQVTVGPRILRTETAGLVVSAICQQHWGDL